MNLGRGSGVSVQGGRAFREVPVVWDNEDCEVVLGAHPPLSPAPARQDWKGVAIWSGWRVVVLAREIVRWRLFGVGWWRLSTCLKSIDCGYLQLGVLEYCNGSPHSGGEARQSQWSPVHGKKIVQTRSLTGGSLGFCRAACFSL